MSKIFFKLRSCSTFKVTEIMHGLSSCYKISFCFSVSRLIWRVLQTAKGIAMSFFFPIVLHILETSGFCRTLIKRNCSNFLKIFTNQNITGGLRIYLLWWQGDKQEKKLEVWKMHVAFRLGKALWDNILILETADPWSPSSWKRSSFIIELF